MKIIINNTSGETVSYASGTVVVAAAATLDVDFIYWKDLVQDPQFISDISLNNIDVTDGNTDYTPDKWNILLDRINVFLLQDSVDSLSAKIPSDLTVTGGKLQVELPPGGSGLTDTELRATPVPISGSITVDTTGLATDVGQIAGNSSLSSIDTKLSGTITVSGPLTDTQLRLTPVPVSGTISTGLAQPLTDTELRATPINVNADTGLLQGLTNTELRATPVPISGTVSIDTTGLATDTLQASGNSSLSSIDTKLSGTIAVSGPLTDIELRATPLPISGTVTANTGLTQPLTDAQIRATALPISGTVTINPLTNSSIVKAQLQDNSGTGIMIGQQLAAASLPVILPAATITTLSTPVVTGIVTANAGTNLNTSALALSATQTDGSQKSIIRGGAKGVTTAADITSTAQSADRQALDVQIRTSAGAVVDTFGGGTQYADGAAKGTSTGTLMMIDDGTNIQSAAGTTAGVLKVDLSATTANSTAIKVDGSAVTQPVSIAASVAVTGPLTDTQLRASSVPVSVNNTAYTSGTMTGASTTLDLDITGFCGVTLDISGTWSIGLIEFFGSVDGTAFFSIYATNTLLMDGQIIVSTLINGQFKFDVTGYKTFRARGTTITGTASLRVRAAMESGVVSSIQAPVYILGGAITATLAAETTKVIGTVNPPAITKGTQGSTGFTVQNIKDAGRTEMRYYAVAAAAGTTGTETAITLTKSSGTAATSTGVSHTPTSGKKFRITAITFATRSNSVATAQSTTFNFRINTGGAVVTTTTPIVLAMRSATSAVASAWDRVYVDIPDGWEITGDGTLQFGITAAATYTTNAPTWDVTIIGYEY